MAVMLSQKLKINMLGTSAVSVSLRDSFGSATNYYCGLILCSGTIPATPETVVTAGQVLITFPTTSLNFGDAAYDATTLLNVVLPQKTVGAWTDTVDVTGVATFYRIYDPAEDGIHDDTTVPTAHCRIQGTVGTTAGYDLIMSNNSLVVGQTITLDTFKLVLF